MPWVIRSLTPAGAGNLDSQEAQLSKTYGQRAISIIAQNKLLRKATPLWLSLGKPNDIYQQVVHGGPPDLCVSPLFGHYPIKPGRIKIARMTMLTKSSILTTPRMLLILTTTTFVLSIPIFLKGT